MNAGNGMIDVRNVTVSFQQNGNALPVLKDVSVDIREGEFVCVIGPSGSGKTTLLNVLAGFVPASGGDVAVNGVAVNGVGEQCSVVFQEYAIFPWLTVLGNVEFGLKMQHTDKAERRRLALSAIELVGLSDFTDYYPYQLSGGMKQRVSIARALAVDRPVLLMDEPLGALDAITRAKLQKDIDALWRDTGKTVFYVTHDLQECVLLASRILVIKAGVFVADFQIELDRPRDPFDAAFVGWTRELSTALEG